MIFVFLYLLIIEVPNLERFVPPSKKINVNIKIGFFVPKITKKKKNRFIRNRYFILEYLISSNLNF